MKIKHPAQYSKAIAAEIAHVLDFEDVRGLVLDPFAGPGQSLVQFVASRRRVLGIEIEQAWVDAGNELLHGIPTCDIELRQGDACNTKLRSKSVAAVVTSPVYGNRMSDHHDAADGSRRRSYTHDLRTMLDNTNAKLAANNAGTMKCTSSEYQELHRAAWREMFRVTKPGGLLLLNVSDFIERGNVVHAATWHLNVVQACGWRWENATPIVTPRMRYGENAEARIEREWLFQFRHTA